VGEGIENAPELFRGMLKGRNFGKQLVRISEEPSH
jgi:NADPH-dependent curcumin reductase CurA